MAEYVRFPTELWLDTRKEDPELTLLRTFYLSHPMQTIDGISRCSDNYVTDYLRFTKAKVASLRRRLIDEGFIVFDEETDEMYLCGFLAINPPKSGTNAVSLQRNVERLRSDAIREAVMSEVGAVMNDRLREFEEQKARKKRENSSSDGLHRSNFSSSREKNASSHLERLIKDKGWSQ